MSREIKFRAWDKINNKMYPIAGISFTNKDTWLQINEKQIMGANFKEIEIMQYVGLKDKNNKEIYEGDIVKIDETEDIDVVKWSDGKEFCIGFGLFSCFEYEVLGNVYENPELLREV